MFDSGEGVYREFENRPFKSSKFPKNKKESKW